MKKINLFIFLFLLAASFNIEARCCPPPDGPRGVTGPQGPTGPEGLPITGPTGPTGAQGTPGDPNTSAPCTTGVTAGRIAMPSSGSAANYTWTATTTSVTLVLDPPFTSTATILATPESPSALSDVVNVVRNGSTINLNVMDTVTNTSATAGFVNFVAFECFSS